MTENEYSIKPLTNLPDITRLEPSKDREGKNREKKPGNKSFQKRKAVESKQEFDERLRLEGLNGLTGDGIDFCA